MIGNVKCLLTLGWNGTKNKNWKIITSHASKSGEKQNIIKHGRLTHN